MTSQEIQALPEKGKRPPMWVLWGHTLTALIRNLRSLLNIYTVLIDYCRMLDKH